jgi:hypothetical protein
MPLISISCIEVIKVVLVVSPELFSLRPIPADLIEEATLAQKQKFPLGQETWLSSRNGNPGCNSMP